MDYDLNTYFSEHSVSKKQENKIAGIKSIAQRYAEFLAKACPRDRELSLALTKLEECVSWAIESVVREKDEEANEEKRRTLADIKRELDVKGIKMTGEELRKIIQKQ